jgi:hypothetical protein
VRFFSLLLTPVVFAAVACGATPSGDAGEEQGLTTAHESAGCAASREQILASTSPARQQVIQRGFVWLDENVPYSQSAEHEGYRTDCSGFVSMCWNLGQSYTTADFSAGGGQSSLLSGYGDLLPGDALVHRSDGSGHVVLFLGWNDPSQSGACVLEQASTASDMQFRVRSTSSLESGGYMAIRADALANDTSVPSAGTSTTPSPTSPASPDPFMTGPSTQDPAPTPTPRTPSTTTPSGSSCVPGKAADLCKAAAAKDGVECGRVDDGCGGEVSCTGILDCKQGLTCGAKKANHCGTKASTEASDVGDDPPPTADSEDAPKPTKTKSSKSSTSTTPQITSGGCSTAPGSSGNGLSLAPLLGIALAASMLRRRSRRA